VLTGRCNFRCPYCRGLTDPCRGDAPADQARHVLQEWQRHSLKHVRFSGGEPTLHPSLPDLVAQAAGTCVRVAVSTNGSAPIARYEDLVRRGASDFSVSLDACCASTADAMSGVPGRWDLVCRNIARLARITYVSVGVVLTEANLDEAAGIIRLADSLGVADIRLIPAAQWSRTLARIEAAPEVLARHPILAWRLENLAAGRPVRGLRPGDNHRCPLVLDDMAVVGDRHWPCIIYLRERGAPIGRFTGIEEVRRQRLAWFLEHDTHADPICAANCLDVCVAYNNRVGNVGARERSQAG
jgi:molybdenum cofactor biosynthesis enzyme MoaA